MYKTKKKVTEENWTESNSKKAKITENTEKAGESEKWGFPWKKGNNQVGNLIQHYTM